MNKLFKAAPLFFVFLLSTNRANAIEPFTASKVSLAGEVGYGVLLGDAVGPSPYALAVGGRGGYTTHYGAYFGGRFDYFFGSSQDTALSELSSHNWAIQGELGYDFGLTDFLVLRPKVGMGVMQIRGEACMILLDTCFKDDKTASAFSVGAEVPISLGIFTLAPETRINVWLGDGGASALHLGLLFGATF